MDVSAKCLKVGSVPTKSNIESSIDNPIRKYFSALNRPCRKNIGKKRLITYSLLLALE